MKKTKLNISLVEFSEKEITLLKELVKRTGCIPECKNFVLSEHIKEEEENIECDLLMIKDNVHERDKKELFKKIQKLRINCPKALICKRFDDNVIHMAVESGIKDIFDNIQDKRLYLFIHSIRDEKRKNIKTQEYIKKIKKEQKKIEMSNQKKSTFLAQLSHEIRTPMTTIVGMTDLTLDTNLTIEQKRYLNICKESANNLLSYMKDIIDYSHIESGKISLEKTDFNLLILIERIVSSLSIKVNKKNLELLYQIDSKVPLQLKGDEKKLRQILVNILYNSIKFTEEGEIFLKAKLYNKKVVKENCLEYEDNQIPLHISISDTGIGIQKENLDIIFDSFTRLDNKETELSKGTGLGLAITKELINLMNGKIWVESQVGKGSVFHFIVPFELSEESFYEDILSYSTDLSHKRILVVNNNSNINLIVKELLEKLCITSEFTSDGEQALEKIKQNFAKKDKFDLYLVDLRLPDMDGYKLIRQIKSNLKNESVNTLIMLPSDENIDYKQYKGLKINDFIEKPLRHLDLLDKVCSCLGKKDIVNPPQSTGLKKINIKKLNILLAEDDEINREVIAKLLKKVGHSVKIVENGKDVLKAIKNNDIDVILMDIKMPEMDGFKATKKIRSSNSPYSKIPIIAMTACVLPGDKQKCIELGMNGYISKPIDGMILVKEVDRIYKEKNN